MAGEGEERARGDGRPFVHRVLFSQGEPRFRAGWRLAIHALMSAALVVALSVLGSILTGRAGVQFDWPWAMAYGVLPAALGVTLATWAARRVLDRRSFASLGLWIDGHAWHDLGMGFALGAAMVGAIFLVLWAAGWLTVTGWAGGAASTSRIVLGDLALFGLVGFSEELLSRGYHLTNLADGLGLAWAVLLTSASFSLFHLGNPGAGAGSVAGILVAGLFFAYARIRTGRLWLPIGAHIGWNLALGLLGFPVSGLRVAALVSQRVVGPAWATGGAFGPEAGVMAPLMVVLGTLAVRAYARNPAAHQVV